MKTLLKNIGSTKVYDLSDGKLVEMPAPRLYIFSGLLTLGAALLGYGMIHLWLSTFLYGDSNVKPGSETLYYIALVFGSLLVLFLFKSALWFLFGKELLFIKAKEVVFKRTFSLFGHRRFKVYGIKKFKAFESYNSADTTFGIPNSADILLSFLPKPTLSFIYNHRRFSFGSGVDQIEGDFIIQYLQTLPGFTRDNFYQKDV